ELKKRIDAWLQKTDKLFSQLSDEEFERHRKSRIISLEKKGESIAEVMGEYYYLVTEEDADFLYKEKLIQAVKDL
ncbi:MAG: hypothetical protein GWM98_24420, partial [Nitrospinaceae bacterium]|nr:hypothetical protein [Nitrospinaceae bacterium]NIR57031.1 hypothetical protein [Nitrospinaceae bacterium]NIS87484.1 hypothetical protein [Nitrospinaceae bacterium]NIT84338.1 hypothetical protein [Nitrospinaceae bacterium]NIU46527.1 hypothetical protein [Nitrospinaceae bacterium]